MAATPASEKMNATTMQASDLRRTTSMNEVTHNVAGTITDKVAQDRKRTSPSQLVGGPTWRMIKGQNATANETILAHMAWVGVITSIGAAFVLRFRFAKKDATDFIRREHNCFFSQTTALIYHEPQSLNKLKFCKDQRRGRQVKRPWPTTQKD